MSQKHRKMKAQLKVEQRQISEPISEDRSAWIYGVGLSLFTFIIYLLTLSPTINGGDSAELILAVASSAVPHPPGYPVFAMLGKLFTFIPFQSVAWRVNLLSAVCDTIAVYIVYLTVYQSTINISAALLAGGMFGLSPLVWGYATVTEVFALHNLLVAILIFLSRKALINPQEKILLAIALVMGLGMAHHQTILFYNVPIVLCLLYTVRPSFTLFLKAVGVFFLGLMPYGYLSWASQGIHLFSWGDQTTFDGLMTHILRKDYGTFKLAAHIQDPNPLIEKFIDCFGYLFRNMLGIGTFFAAIGVYQILHAPQQSKKIFGILTAACFAFYLGTFVSLSNL
jgi:hypothetical protein